MLWWLSSARSRRRVWLRLSARCLKSKTSSLIYLDNNMALSDAEALKMDRSAAADVLCGCAFCILTTAAFVEGFVWVEKFLPLCRRCDSYGTRWTCPPFDFDPMTIWHSYTGLLLYARILQADTPEQPLEEALAALKREKLLYRDKLQQWERDTPGSIFTCPCSGDGRAKRRTILCWWAACC